MKRVAIFLLLVYGTVSLILTILVNDQTLYLPIDEMSASIWGYVFSVFNPFPIIYWGILILQHGPSVWINSSTMTAVFFAYPIVLLGNSLLLFFIHELNQRKATTNKPTVSAQTDNEHQESMREETILKVHARANVRVILDLR